jgi:hypothetical protein
MSLPGQLVRTQRFTSGVPAQFTVTLDGAAVLFLRSRAGGDPAGRLWVLELASGAECCVGRTSSTRRQLGRETATSGSTTPTGASGSSVIR